MTQASTCWRRSCRSLKASAKSCRRARSAGSLPAVRFDLIRKRSTSKDIGLEERESRAFTAANAHSHESAAIDAATSAHRSMPTDRPTRPTIQIVIVSLYRNGRRCASLRCRRGVHGVEKFAATPGLATRQASSSLSVPAAERNIISTVDMVKGVDADAEGPRCSQAERHRLGRSTLDHKLETSNERDVDGPWCSPCCW